MTTTDLAVSIVVPVRNEAGNIAPLVEEIAAAVDGQWPFEVVYVNDGSSDTTDDELRSLMARYPWLRHIFADGGYAGEKLRTALKRIGEWTIEIIKRSDTAQGFEVLPRRWVVERTFAWLGRCRRLAKDFEATIASAVAWAFLAHIRTLTRRLARA